MTMDRGMFAQAHRDRSSYRKLTEEGVRWIRGRREDGLSIREICEAFKAETGKSIGKSTVGDLLRGQNHSDVV